MPRAISNINDCAVYASGATADRVFSRGSADGARLNFLNEGVVAVEVAQAL
jgi:hypothetical protein